MTELTCWNCAAAIVDEPLPLSRRASCRSCFAELHCCAMCRHYAPGVPDQCEQEGTEPPANKQVANVCDWFDPAAGRGSARDEDAARARLDALFGDSATASNASPADDAAGNARDDEEENDPAAAARARLQDLFDRPGE